MIVLPSAPGPTLFPSAPEDPNANFSLDRLPDHYGEEKGGTFRLTLGQHFDYGPEGCKCPTCDGWRRDAENRRKAERRQKELDGELKDGIITKREHATRVGLLKRCPNHKYLAYDEYGTGYGGYVGFCRIAKLTPIAREQYKADLIESHLDLDRRHPDKFKRVNAAGQSTDEYTPAPTPFPLEKMGVAELLAVAAEEEIDLASVKKDKAGALDKADLLRVVQGSRNV